VTTEARKFLIPNDILDVVPIELLLRLIADSQDPSQSRLRDQITTHIKQYQLTFDQIVSISSEDLSGKYRLDHMSLKIIDQALLFLLPIIKKIIDETVDLDRTSMGYE